MVRLMQVQIRATWQRRRSHSSDLIAKSPQPRPFSRETRNAARPTLRPKLSFTTGHPHKHLRKSDAMQTTLTHDEAAVRDLNDLPTPDVVETRVWSQEHAWLYALLHSDANVGRR